MENSKIADARHAVVAIGYYIPHKNPRWLGTGFIVGDEGYIMTCAHVVLYRRGDKIIHRPLVFEENGANLELSCWLFRFHDSKEYIMRLPIKAIATFTNIHMEGTYFGEIPDAALVTIDISQWRNNFTNECIPRLEVSPKVERNIGRNVAIIGYPSINELMAATPPKKFKCLEPLIQFSHLAGVLPFMECPYPHFLAFDSVFAKGSSGSPICDIESGKVIAMAAELHPFLLPVFSDENDRIIGQGSVPSGIGLGVPSNFFYEMSLSKGGEGKFDF